MPLCVFREVRDQGAEEEDRRVDEDQKKERERKTVCVCSISEQRVGKRMVKTRGREEKRRK